MYALQESVRRVRGVAAAQAKGAKISVVHGVGGMFAASGSCSAMSGGERAMPTMGIRR
jgi:hypothetical protein